MSVVTQTIGQSMYDLALQTYGTQDYLVKLCVDNNITDINTVIPQIQYTYDQNLIKNQAIKGYVYATDSQISNRVFSDEFSIEFG